MAEDMNAQNIVLIGAGTIGLSFAAFHLTHLPLGAQLTIIDTRPDLQDYVRDTLPKLLSQEQHSLISHVNTSASLTPAIITATIIQESGPENLEFKTKLWSTIEHNAPADCLFWSSTSGIPASAQSSEMVDKSRVIVVHPFNPPHIMPLLELVPSPVTAAKVIERTQAYWEACGRTPILLKKEVPGFVANRLAFALFREAISLVNEGVVGPAELDKIVETSMGPRWAVAGPFRSYVAGGGEAGLSGFFDKIGGTVQEVWDDMDTKEKISIDGQWKKQLCEEAESVYGELNGELERRDTLTKGILQVMARGE